MSRVYILILIVSTSFLKDGVYGLKLETKDYHCDKDVEGYKCFGGTFDNSKKVFKTGEG